MTLVTSLLLQVALVMSISTIACAAALVAWDIIVL